MLTRIVKSMVKKNQIVIKHGLGTSNVKVNIMVHPKDMPKSQPTVKVIDTSNIALIFEDPEIIVGCWDVVVTKEKRGGQDED